MTVPAGGTLKVIQACDLMRQVLLERLEHGGRAANELRRRLPRPHRVLLVEKDLRHAFAPSFLWVMVGGRIRSRVTCGPWSGMLTTFLAAPPYAGEHAATAVRLARAAIGAGHRVNIFASADGVHGFTVGHRAKGLPNAETVLIF